MHNELISDTLWAEAEAIRKRVFNVRSMGVAQHKDSNSVSVKAPRITNKSHGGTREGQCGFCDLSPRIL